MAAVKISVIVPVFNEAATISPLLKKLLTITTVAEVIVVDDGSTDKTAQIIKKIKHKKLQYFRKKNGGKGSAVRYGITKVTKEYVLIQDADLEYDPDDIEKLLAPIIKGKVQVVYGSRFLGPHLNLLFWHWVGNTFLNFLVNILYNTTLSDMETCYKVVPTKLLRKINLQANDFTIEPEITCKILKRGIRIYEVPISYVGRDFSEGKKITWKDGVVALVAIIRIRLES